MSRGTRGNTVQLLWTKSKAKMAGQKQQEQLAYLSKGESVVEEGMGLVERRW